MLDNITSHLTAHSDRLVSGVGHEVAINGDGLAHVLVSPASVVTIGLDTEAHVSKVGHQIGLAIIQSLQGRQVGLANKIS